MDAIPELTYLKNDQLTDLLHCEDKLMNFVESLPDLNAIINRAQQLAEENEILSNENLEKRVDYEKSRQTTINKIEELSSLHSKFDQLIVNHHQLCERLAPINIQEATLAIAAQSEEESEVIAEDFISNKMDISKFLNQYLDKRIESHTRKFKGDRLGAQLKELQRAGF